MKLSDIEKLRKLPNSYRFEMSLSCAAYDVIELNETIGASEANMLAERAYFTLNGAPKGIGRVSMIALQKFLDDAMQSI